MHCKIKVENLFPRFTKRRIAMKELKLSELSIKQKIGLTMIASVSSLKEQFEYCLELIRARSLGGIYINPAFKNRDELIARVKEAADYPILIMCDAEDGIDGHFIGAQNALGMTDNEDLAYAFGKVLGVSARNLGYNIINSPVLDMVNFNCTCGGTTRAFSGNKHRVSAIAEAMIRGMHDGGILAVCKHYPGTAQSGRTIDAHMGETVSPETVEELLDYNLFPYLHLLERGLLDGIMTEHARFTSVDADYPASLSKKCIDIIRDKGFDGLALTDALCMMGVVSKFGKKGSIGLAMAAGNDITLPFHHDNRFSYESQLQCFEEGVFSEEELDRAVSRVLAAQKKTMEEPKYSELTKSDLENFDRISRECVFARVDEGLEIPISKDGRHYFAILTESQIDIQQRDKVDVDTLNKSWYNPLAIADRLKQLFPNSEVYLMNQFPTGNENLKLLDRSLGYDDVVFVTFFASAAYIGTECLTSRVVSVIEAMQQSNRISTVVHFGNPFVLEDLAHIPRVVIGSTSRDSINAALDVLAGSIEAKGVLTYDVKLK